ncbi:lipase maturation factor family protein [Nannocystis sp. SCPEA4]|uniref:lipase maturation factor family protein n=1 Tax=Nannocystis sp. SCPEA4 TaxID=2996787 RepID=UPI0022702EBF|nr:lipase maturation factor family protein [Nannocystis sp. SCPEA4]MCY1056438.1 lipase maturation factor family protein [Nannocystis sp. SCPEA4]
MTERTTPPARFAAMSPDSGPVVARLFHAALGLVFVIAFASLRVQLVPLLGTGGLAPVAEAVAQARPGGWWATPTLFWWWSGDAALRGATTLGIVAGALALAGVWPRVFLAIATLLYLSFVSVGAPFLQFQWDSLLVECGVLALLLPRDRPSPTAHLLLLFAAFKLYFESGLAKGWSPLGDWWDGSAMSYYYETAPLPGPLAWYAHNLPGWWHALESRATLVLELVVPFLLFCGRRGRLVALVVLTGFQLLNLATANYGFFVYLALALHLFMLRDADLLRLYARLPGRRAWGRVLLPREGVPAPRWPRLRAWLLSGFAVVYLVLSLATARVELGGRAGPWAAALQRHTGQLHVFNAYHLFAQITRVRVEPEFAAYEDGAWRVYDMHDKPGPLDRAPPLVAPHQPRLDFMLWFYGLGARRAPPGYVRRLLRLLCEDPARAQYFFATPLLPRPSHVRVQYWRYTFTRPGEVGCWRREPAAPERVMTCTKGQVMR